MCRWLTQYYGVFVMGFISVLNICFGYESDNVLLDGVSYVFNDSDKIAIVGDNGAGKSTLLRLLAGQLVPESGTVDRKASVYFLNQIKQDGSKSGGERQLFELARAFDSNAEILLLDEPTNNLDVDAKSYFLGELFAYPFGVVIVSHDRELLQYVDKIIEISNGKIRVYGGNYDFWIAQKRAEQENIYAQYVDSNKEIARLQGTLNRAQNTRQHHVLKQKKDKANSAAGSRMVVNALKGKSQETEAKKHAIIQKKLDAQLALQQDLSMQMRDEKIKIPVPNKSFYSKELVRVSDVCFAYDKKSVLKDFDFVMYGATRVRLTGKNGAGKSTLLKLICGQLIPQSGTIKTFGKISYLNQDLSVLDKNKTIVENIMDVAGVLRHDAHAFAANFGFRGDLSKKVVGVLSGGELLKATLAAVLGGAEQPDLLILDEPTNNLEIKSIQILEDALNHYRGAILLVSHDEMFARNINIDTVVQIG